MTISKVYPAGWSIGEKLTSAQMNALDTNVTYAADKRVGTTDIIYSVWSASGAGRLVGTYAVGANTDTTYLISGGNSLIDVAALTANRIYSFSSTGAVAGDRIHVVNRSAYYVTVRNSAGTDLIHLGSIIDEAGSGESFWCELLHTGSEWILFKSSKPTAIEETEFLATGSYVVPRSITQALVLGWGGGGAGGGGATQTTGFADYTSCGGAGGGGALMCVTCIRVIPGETLTVNVGAGGAPVAADVNGGDGGDSSVLRGGTPLAIMLGAQGGYASPGAGLAEVTFNGGPVPYYGTASGGSPIRASGGLGVAVSMDSSTMQDRGAQVGGRGRTGNGNHAYSTERGMSSPTGYAGGLSGSAGADDGSYLGGGGGGGGGAGPSGAGGAGANGGAGGDGVAAGAGGNGTAAAANTGGGGGGGGGGGHSDALAGSGGSSGAGGTGRVLIIPTR